MHNDDKAFPAYIESKFDHSESAGPGLLHLQQLTLKTDLVMSTI